MTPDEKRRINAEPISPEIFAMVAHWPKPSREAIARVRRLMELDVRPLGTPEEEMRYAS